MRRILLPLLLPFLFVMGASATAITGTYKVNGSPFNGSMTFALSYPATNGSYLNLPIESAPFAITNGTFTPFAIDGNDTMLPAKTYYIASVYDLYGGLVSRTPYYISGFAFDLGAAVPTPILSNNLSFLDLLGLRSLSVQQLTILSGGSLTFGNLNLSSAGVTGALQVNSILFASAYNTANPSSTTCGIQEAVTALPASGGIVILPNTTCTVSTTIIISKPVKLLGFGSGGYTDVAHTQVSAPTLLVDHVPAGFALISITPPAHLPLYGVVLEGFAMKGAATFGGPLVAVGGINDTTAQANNIVLRHLFGYGAQASGVYVGGNVVGLRIEDCVVDSSAAAGLFLTNTFSVGNPTMTGVEVDHSYFTHGGAQGVKIDSNGVGVVRVSASHIDFNTSDNLLVTSVSATTVLQTSSSSYLSSTSGSGINFSGGYGHTITGDTITGNNQYGVYVNNTVSGPHAAIIRDVIWGSNTIKDLFLNLSTTLLYPSATGMPTTGGLATLQTITLSPATPY